jgi:hypothetical protein
MQQSLGESILVHADYTYHWRHQTLSKSKAASWFVLLHVFCHRFQSTGASSTSIHLTLVLPNPHLLLPLTSSWHQCSNLLESRSSYMQTTHAIGDIRLWVRAKLPVGSFSYMCFAIVFSPQEPPLRLSISHWSFLILISFCLQPVPGTNAAVTWRVSPRQCGQHVRSIEATSWLVLLRMSVSGNSFAESDMGPSMYSCSCCIPLHYVYHLTLVLPLLLCLQPVPGANAAVTWGVGPHQFGHVQTIEVSHFG